MVQLLPKLTRLLRWFPISLARSLALIAGFFAFLFDRRRRRAVLKNVRMLRPDWGRPRRYLAALKTFLHLYENIVDLANTPNLSDGEVLTLFERAGPREAEGMRDRGEGFILLVAHLGAWEVGAAWLGAAGFKGIALAEPISDNAHYEILEVYRRRGGIEVLPADVNPIRLVRALKESKALLLLGDRDVLGTGQVVKFGEGRRRLPKGPAELSKRLGVPVVPAFVLRRTLNPFARRPFLGLTLPAFWPQSAEDVARVLEEVIAQHVEQWMVFQDEWV